MSDSKIIRINTVLFFIGWTFIMFVGADFPPPPGFIWVVLLLLILDIIQYKYLYFFLKQIHQKRKNLFVLNLFFFFVGGVFLSLMILGIQITTTPPMNLSDSMLWVGVVSCVGGLYGIVFYLFNTWLVKN